MDRFDERVDVDRQLAVRSNRDQIGNGIDQGEQLVLDALIIRDDEHAVTDYGDQVQGIENQVERQPQRNVIGFDRDRIVHIDTCRGESDRIDHERNVGFRVERTNHLDERRLVEGDRHLACEYPRGLSVFFVADSREHRFDRIGVADAFPVPRFRLRLRLRLGNGFEENHHQHAETDTEDHADRALHRAPRDLDRRGMIEPEIHPKSP